MTGLCQSLEALPVAAWEAEITAAGDVEVFIVVETSPGQWRRNVALLEVSLSREQARGLGEALVRQAEALPLDPSD
ncbi:hypothetical protein ACFQU1_20630 [Chelatococcus sp. GCM10030263]|uniref:hypothetical protein n=1 Tax=Chelatococcus sp. GCM10030263 TaxID=3273387 RepID=UPI0036087354